MEEHSTRTVGDEGGKEDDIAWVGLQRNPCVLITKLLRNCLELGSKKTLGVLARHYLEAS